MTEVTFSATAQEPTTLVEVGMSADPVVEDEEVPVTVQINDQDGEAIAGVTLQFSADELDATVEATGVAPLQTITAESDADGQVIVTWTIGAATGADAQSLTVTVPSDDDVTPLVIAKTVN